jgi:hypothetical protein
VTLDEFIEKQLTDPRFRREWIKGLEEERDEARDIACKLLRIAEARGPRVFGPRPDWLEVKG